MGREKKELWKAVPGYEGLYEASTEGRVRAVDKTVLVEDKVRGITFGRRYPEREISGQLNPFGYIRIRLSKDGIRKQIMFHVVIASTFVGARPTEAHEVNHINGRKTDNRAVNLEWVTRRENIHHSRHVLGSHPKKLTVQAVEEIATTNQSLASLARKYRVSESAVAKVRSGKTWTHITTGLGGA